MASRERLGSGTGSARPSASRGNMRSRVNPSASARARPAADGTTGRPAFPLRMAFVRCPAVRETCASLDLMKT